MKITNPTKPFGCGEKRFYMAGVRIEENCTTCGKPVVMDFDRDYLSYPTFNAPTVVKLYCEGCDAVTSVTVLLRLTIEAA